MPVQTQLQQRRGTAASWTSTNPTLAAGEIGFETDTGKFKIGNGSTAWASLAYSAGATAVTYLFNATSGQTTFSGADANGLTLAYTVGAEQVYLNGVLQVRGSDYTATNGTSIVLASGALTGDVLNVIAYSAMTITDTYTQAQADAKFVQQTNNFFAGKNKIINGDFGIWQRGTSLTYTTNAGALIADRFLLNFAGTFTGTVSQQTFTPGTAPVAGYEGTYFCRVNRTGTTSVAPTFYQRIENVRTLAGQTVTFSFWAKADASRSVTLNYYQAFGTGGSGAATAGVGTAALTTSWQRFTFTFAMPSVSGKTIGTDSWTTVYFDLPDSTAFTFDIWGVQLEAGSIATPFQTATGTLAGELAACQRYYFRRSGTTNYMVANSAVAYSSTFSMAYIQPPVVMRTAPSSMDISNVSYVQYDEATTSLSSYLLNGSRSTESQIYIYASGTGMTAGRFGTWAINNTTGYLGFSAEL